MEIKENYKQKVNYSKLELVEIRNMRDGTLRIIGLQNIHQITITFDESEQTKLIKHLQPK